MMTPSSPTVCPDCGKPDAVNFGDGGCMARCKDRNFRTDVRCKTDTIALLRSKNADLERINAELRSQLAAANVEIYRAADTILDLEEQLADVDFMHEGQA